MEECQNLEKCSFFKEYEQDERMQPALEGFIRLYCRGREQDYCVRKKVSKALGGPAAVPVNMKPNGKPKIGTSSEDWPEKVKAIVYDLV